MARYIIIDRNSGYIWGDSADIGGKIVTGTPTEVARALDESLGEIGWTYEDTHLRDAQATYDVYRADINGSEAVSNITDGQDQEQIDAVLRDCEYVTTIVRTKAE